MSDKRRFTRDRLDESALKVVKETYPQGIQVEAVRVKDVKTGTKGIVREVRNNGDISVIWCTGDITCCEYSVDSIKIVVQDTHCLLRNRVEECGKDKDVCAKCGWNEKVSKERVERIRAGGMTRGEDGILRLYVGSKEVVALPENC